MDFLENVGEEYGTGEDGLPPSSDDYSGVVVPKVGFSLETEQYRNLQQLVDPLRESNNYGIDLYKETLLFLTDLSPVQCNFVYIMDF